MPRVPGLWYIRPYKSTERSTCPSVVKHHPSAVRHGAPAGDEHSSIFSQPCGCSPAPLCSDLHCSQSSPTSRRDKEEEAGPQPSLSGFRCPHILTLGWKTNLLLSATVALLPARGLLRVAGRHWADWLAPPGWARAPAPWPHAHLPSTGGENDVPWNRVPTWGGLHPSTVNAHLLSTSQQGDAETKAHASVQHQESSFQSCVEASLHPWDTQHRNFSWTSPHLPFHFWSTAQKWSSVIPNQHQATSLPFQYPCVSTSAQSCCLAFTTDEEIAHGPLPEPWCAFPDSFSCRGTSMSLYCKTLPFHILKCCPWVRNMHTLWMRIMNWWFHYLIFQHISICAVAYGEIIR